jgi:hypothetical protein
VDVTRSSLVALSMSDFNLQMDEKPHPQSHRGCISLRNQFVTVILAVLTAMTMTFTIFFAYNSSLKRPFLPSFVPKTPERSILILNLTLNITLFTLGELTSSVLEATRWALACGASGTTALTFLILSRATSFLGTIYLSIGRSRVAGRNGHQVWGLQRYLFHS